MDSVTVNLAKAVQRFLDAQDALDAFHDPECYPQPADALTPGFVEANKAWSAAESALRELMATKRLQNAAKDIPDPGPALIQPSKS
jgi:hypothetical protein